MNIITVIKNGMRSDMKSCTVCNKVKDNSEFRIINKLMGHLQSACLICERIQRIKNQRITQQYYKQGLPVITKILRPCIGINCRGEKSKWIAKGRFICEDCVSAIKNMSECCY